VAIFQGGFDRWADDPGSASLSTRIQETAGQLAGAISSDDNAPTGSS
jgi:hypothetical protein